MDTLITFFPMHIFSTKFRVKVKLIEKSDFKVKFFKNNYVGLQFILKLKSIFILYFQKMSLLVKKTGLFSNFHPLHSSGNLIF
jgi:hypothetical protein